MTHSNEVRSSLRRGLLVARLGNRAQARRWFQAARSADPDNTVALLWLAWLAPTRQESLALFGRVLELDPRNERARAGIRWARRRPSGREVSSDWPGDGLPDVVQPPPPPPGKEIAAHHAHRSAGPLGLLLVIAICAFATGVALMAWYSPATVLALVLPAVTPTPTSTPTLTATPTITATSTSSPTPTVTNTATPARAPPPTSTPTVPPPPPPTATPVPPTSPPQAGGEKWIDVDLTHQRVTAYEGDTFVFSAVVSTGLPNTPTVVGQFRIYWKLSATDMAGPGYYLPGVPYTMYFHRGYALHGTYWHHNFGQPMSHGCVNLRLEDAQWLFNWADPPLPPGASHVRSSNANPGTLVVVHY